MINSFDFEVDDIKEEMESHRIVADVFEIDRLQPDHRLEYLNCFQEMYGSRKLPMIFMDDKLVGGLREFRSQVAGTP